jgi:RNA polymerase sigma-70 factor (ECF subfamily)
MAMHGPPSKTNGQDFRDGIIAAMPKLRSFAFSMCRNLDRSDDLVQDTMLAALANEDKFTPGTILDAWLFTILRNKFRSGLRKYSREIEDPDGLIASTVPIEDSGLKKLEAMEAIDLIGKMPPQWREPLRMIGDGATYEEVANELCEQVGTIKSRVNRARAMLGNAE